jgi:uncharacterized membrane protein
LGNLAPRLSTKYTIAIGRWTRWASVHEFVEPFPSKGKLVALHLLDKPDIVKTAGSTEAFVVWL